MTRWCTHLCPAFMVSKPPRAESFLGDSRPGASKTTMIQSGGITCVDLSNQEQVQPHQGAGSGTRSGRRAAASYSRFVRPSTKSRARSAAPRLYRVRRKGQEHLPIGELEEVLKVVENAGIVACLVQPASAVGESRDHPVGLIHLELDWLILRVGKLHLSRRTARGGRVYPLG